MDVRERGALMPTLPGRDYVSAEVYEVERERVFAAGWTCVGREEHVPNAGDFVTREVLGEPVFVIRDRAGAVRAFANACRHRGTRLLDGSGSVRGAIKCPYHAWTYGFDGALLGAPNVKERDGLVQEEHGLWEIRLETFDGFVLVNLAPGRSGRSSSRCPTRRCAPAVRRWRAARRGVADLRRRGQLKDRRRELPRVPPLPDGAPGAREARAAVSRRRGRGGRADARQLDGPRTDVVHVDRPVEPAPSRSTPRAPSGRRS